MRNPRIRALDTDGTWKQRVETADAVTYYGYKSRDGAISWDKYVVPLSATVVHQGGVTRVIDATRVEERRGNGTTRIRWR